MVQQAVEQKVTRGAKLRLDTTVVEAPIHHPTDSRLCEDVVRVLGRSLKRLVEAGVKLSFKVRNVSRQVGRRMREITQAVRLRGTTQRKRALNKPYRRLLRVTGRGGSPGHSSLPRDARPTATSSWPIERAGSAHREAS